MAEYKYEEFFNHLKNRYKESLRFTETSLNRIRKHGEDGFVVISTNRSKVFSDNKNNDLSKDYFEFCRVNDLEESEDSERKFLNARNHRCDRELFDYLKSKDNPYTFTPVFGGYHGSDNVTDSYEPSFIVYNSLNNKKDKEGSWEDLKKKALEWCKKYKQDSVYIQAPNEAPVYLDCDGNKVNSSESKNFKFNRGDEKYYTTTKRDKSNPSRFTADIRFESMRLRSFPSSYNEKMMRSYSGEVWDLI